MLRIFLSGLSLGCVIGIIIGYRTLFSKSKTKYYEKGKHPVDLYIAKLRAVSPEQVGDPGRQEVDSG